MRKPRVFTLPEETHSKFAPKNGCLEYFFVSFVPLFSGAFAASFREGKYFRALNLKIQTASATCYMLQTANLENHMLPLRIPQNPTLDAVFSEVFAALSRCVYCYSWSSLCGSLQTARLDPGVFGSP